VFSVLGDFFRMPPFLARSLRIVVFILLLVPPPLNPLSRCKPRRRADETREQQSSRTASQQDNIYKSNQIKYHIGSAAARQQGVTVLRRL
jgi:hypothetical protein